MTEMIERATKAVFDAMDIADGLDGTVAEKYARAAIAATPLADAIKAFEKISNFSDYEMGDGDGARQVADEWLERWKPEIDQALVELGPLRPAGTADLYGVPRAEE